MQVTQAEAKQMALRRGLLWLVLCALVTAQALGLMHRVIHGPHVAIGHEAAAFRVPDSRSMSQADAAAHASGVPHGNGWVASLFTGHSDDSTCRLFDPLNHEAAPTVPCITLPVISVFFFIDFFQGEFLARWAALYDARGPPSPR